MAVNTPDIQDLIQTAIQRLLITPLEQASSFLSSGPRIFDTASPISIPKLTGSFSPGFVGESELIPEDSGVGFDAVGLLPSTMRSIKTLIRLSSESLRMSTLSLDSVLQDRLVKDVSGKLDAQAWSASGDGVTTPRGVLAPANVAGFAKIDAAGAAISLDTLHDAYGRALADDVPLSSLKWVMSPTMLTSLRKIKTATGSREYVVTDNVAGTPGGLTLLGLPVTITKRLAPSGTVQAPKEHLLLWSPSSWAVARDLSPTAVVDRSRYLEYDQVALRIVSRFDWAPLQPEATVLVQNALPAAA